MTRHLTLWHRATNLDVDARSNCVKQKFSKINIVALPVCASNAQVRINGSEPLYTPEKAGELVVAISVQRFQCEHPKSKLETERQLKGGS